MTEEAVLHFPIIGLLPWVKNMFMDALESDARCFGVLSQYKHKV